MVACGFEPPAKRLQRLRLPRALLQPYNNNNRFTAT